MATIFGAGGGAGGGGGAGATGAAGGAGGFSFEQAMPTPIIKTNAETKLAPRITDLPRPSGAAGSIGKPARGRNLRTQAADVRIAVPDVRFASDATSVTWNARDPSGPDLAETWARDISPLLPALGAAPAAAVSVAKTPSDKRSCKVRGESMKRSSGVIGGGISILVVASIFGGCGGGTPAAGSERGACLAGGACGERARLSLERLRSAGRR